MRTLALLVVAATSAAPTCAASAGPVWSIHRPGGGTVYLAGSVHVLDTARSRLPPAFDSAWRDAERVVMELDMDDLDPAAAASFLAAHATIGDGENLRTLLGAERFARVDTQARALGLSLDSVAQLEPWAVALALTQLQLVKLGLDPSQGVEQQLTARARAEGKPIAGLETIDEQLGVLDGLSSMDQARFLELTAGESDSMATELDGIGGGGRVRALVCQVPGSEVSVERGTSGLEPYVAVTQSLVLPVAAVAGTPVRLRFATRAETFDGRSELEGTFRFAGLPPGAVVTSCRGYSSDAPVAGRGSSWGRIKTLWR